ncbi:MAG: hypothetical protein EBU93_02170 [Chlamydiae bacterium]|jgi:hypothetical protein|nr:hypothetical protein [Chlamydiota bacterium]
MHLIERLKEAIAYLDDSELLLRKNASIIHKEIEPVQSEFIPKKEDVVEDLEKLPFTPIRKSIGKSIFSKSLNLEKSKKEAPKIIQSEKVDEAKPIDSFQDVKSILKSLFKELKIYDDLPDDKEAKLLAKLYENKSIFKECVILYEPSLKKGGSLLHSLTQAIEKRFTSCQLLSIEEIEEKEQLDILLKDKKIRLFICTQDLLWHHPKLLSHYIETTGSSIKRIGTKDLVVLLNLEYYLKDPLLKRSLWNQLMGYFKK